MNLLNLLNQVLIATDHYWSITVVWSLAVTTISKGRRLWIDVSKQVEKSAGGLLTLCWHLAKCQVFSCQLWQQISMKCLVDSGLILARQAQCIMNGGTEASKGKINATNALITSTVDSSVCSRFVCLHLLANLLPLGALNATKLSSMILLQMAPGAESK